MMKTKKTILFLSCFMTLVFSICAEAGLTFTITNQTNTSYDIHTQCGNASANPILNKVDAKNTVTTQITDNGIGGNSCQFKIGRNLYTDLVSIITIKDSKLFNKKDYDNHRVDINSSANAKITATIIR